MAEPFRVEQEPDAPIPFPKPPIGQQAAITGILIGLKALSQGAVIALQHLALNLFSLLTIASAFWLFLTIPDPNPNQLTLLGMYGLLVLLANLIVRRK